MFDISARFGEDDGAAPRTLTSAVLRQLRTDILANRLAPGQKLNIAALAKKFAVSLAAVREALSRLVADGLVQASDQRGFWVSPVSRADLEDVTRTRIDIEGLALRRSIERGDGAWLDAVQRAFAALNAVPFRDPNDGSSHNEAWVGKHRIFHRTLVETCGSLWLLGFRDILHEQSERYRRLSIYGHSSPPRDVEGEHRCIVEAVVRRDADGAVAALECHFMKTMDFVDVALPILTTKTSM